MSVRNGQELEFAQAGDRLIECLSHGESDNSAMTMIRRIAIATFVAVFTQHAGHCAEEYLLLELGTLTGFEDSNRAYGIGPTGLLGKVVGDMNSNSGETRAFAWNPKEGFENLGVLPVTGAKNSTALAVNGLGEIVGRSQVCMPSGGGGTTCTLHPFIWTAASQMQQIPGLNGGIANDINESSQVVGSSSSKAFRWSSIAGLQLLGDLPGGGEDATANAINSAGHAAGKSRAANDFRGFIWDPINEMRDVGDLPGGNDESESLDLNDLGQVVGWSDTSNREHAFIWDEDNGIQELDDIAEGSHSSFAYAINNSSEVVGHYFPLVGGGGRRAFIWTAEDGMRDLGSLVNETGDGWRLEKAIDMNDRGEIVGFGRNPDGPKRAYLLIPLGLYAGDLDLDGDSDFDDIDDFILGLDSPVAYEALFGVDPTIAGDTDLDGDQDFDDISGFIDILNAPPLAGVQRVPEPSALLLAGVGLVTLVGHCQFRSTEQRCRKPSNLLLASCRSGDSHG